uniref:Uncharacterized protein n=1 Tax=Arundo donax TaxID=35708 RepID=A0A0A8YHV6_ARUDO
MINGTKEYKSFKNKRRRFLFFLNSKESFVG